MKSTVINLSASGIPMYAFFGPTRSARGHTLGQGHRILIHPFPCSPCLRKLGPEEVIRRLAENGLL